MTSAVARKPGDIHKVSRVCVFSLLLLGISLQAVAADYLFKEDYKEGENRFFTETVDKDKSARFLVNGIFSFNVFDSYTTRWYEYDSQGNPILKDTDISNALNGFYDPEYTKTFSQVGGPFQIEADIFKNGVYQNWMIWDVTVIEDITPPSPPGPPNLASSDDTGRSNSDDITKKTSNLTFSWSPSLDSESGVAGYEWGLENSTWKWIGNSTSVDTDASNGPHTFYVRARDNANNTGPWSSLPFTVDAVRPNIPSIIYPSVNQRITDTTPAFDWSGSDNSGGSGIWQYEILVETDTLKIDRIHEFPTSSSYPTPSSQALDAGGEGYVWEVWAYDVAGNQSLGTGEKLFFIDDSPTIDASITITVTPDPVLLGNAITVNYTVTNTGNVSHAFGVGCDINEGTLNGKDVLIERPPASQTTPTLAPGASATGSFIVTIPAISLSGKYNAVCAVWTGTPGASTHLGSARRYFDVEYVTPTTYPPWGSNTKPYGLVDDLASREFPAGVRRDSSDYGYYFTRRGVLQSNGLTNATGPYGDVSLGYTDLTNLTSPNTFETELFLMRTWAQLLDPTNPEECFRENGEFLFWDSENLKPRRSWDTALNELDLTDVQDFDANALITFKWNYHLFRKLHPPSSLQDARSPSTDLDPATTTKVIVLIHGWNPAGAANPFTLDPVSPDESYWYNVSQNIQTWLNDNGMFDWKVVEYNWAEDADTGPTLSQNPAAPETASVGTSEDTTEEPKAVDIAPLQNGTEAAEVAHLHGQRLGEILSSYGNLEKVQFIAHSAGSWCARTAATHLLNATTGPTPDVQVTLLDPFMPREATADSALGAAIIGELDDQTRVPAFLENYYSLRPLAILGTSSEFSWDGPDVRQLRIDEDLTSLSPYGEYSGHSGPIKYYAATINETVVEESFWAGYFEWRDTGWFVSLPYIESLQPSKPDIRVISGIPTVTPNTVSPGGTVVVSSITIDNAGELPTGFFSTGYYLSTDSTIDASDFLLLSQGIANLDQDEPFTHPIRTLTIPADTIPDTYWVGYFADYTDVVDESDENNNTVARQITVVPPPPSKPINPKPIDGAIDQSITVDLSWSDGGDATSYDIYFNDVFLVKQSGTTFDPGTLTHDTPYIWRIDAVNSVGTTMGDDWRFRTKTDPIVLPMKPINPDPSDGAFDQPITIYLSWSDGGDATSYDVYFDGVFQRNQPETSLDPGTLTHDTPYSWRIDAVNSVGTTTGDNWSFRTELTPPLSPLAYYAFDEGSGSIASDSAGSFDGTVQGATWASPGESEAGSSALIFGAAGDAVQLPNGTINDLPIGSFSCWIHPTDRPARNAYIVSKQVSGSVALFDIYITPSGKIDMNVGGAAGFTESVATIPLNVWTHIAVTWDGIEKKLYIGGSLDSSGGAATVSKNPNTTFIGRAVTDENDRFVGTIDEVKVWNKTLTAAQVEEEANVLLGDVNTDGSVNSTDALWVIQAEFGLRPPLPLDKCDMNCDGVCNSTDALWIIQVEFGLRPQPSRCP